MIVVFIRAISDRQSRNYILMLEDTEFHRCVIGPRSYNSQLIQDEHTIVRATLSYLGIHKPELEF